jgi:hypothetical protein
MSAASQRAHCAAVEVAVPARTAFAFMADGMKQTHWALGSMERREVEPGLFAGVSRFDYEELFVRLRSNAELMVVDYYAGKDPERLRWIVESRVIPGDHLEIGEDRCLITLTTWRSDHADDDWVLKYHVWQTEIQLIKGRIEYEARVGAGAG